MITIPRYVWAMLSLFLFVMVLSKLGWITPSAQKGQISVSGLGEVSAIPDIAEISLTIQTESKTAKEVQRLSAEKSNTLQKFCIDAGINKKDLQTSQYRLEPTYFYIANQPPQLSGFRIVQTLKVTVRDLDKTGEILAGAVLAGANQLDGPYFSIDKKDALIKEARKLAFANAKEKAQEQADAAGMKLGKVLGFSEGFAGNMDSPSSSRMLKVTMEAAAAPSIEAGSEKIAVSVSIQYELK